MYYVYVYSIYMSTSMYKVYSLYRLYIILYIDEGQDASFLTTKS